MVIKMRHCITVIYFREVESKREIHNHNQRTLRILITSLETREYLYGTFLSRLCYLVVQFLDVSSHQPAFLKLKHVVRREKRADVQAGNLQKYVA